jgi:D-glycero-D-manno-heptose 1,7-bisphosphate phosphatase
MMSRRVVFLDRDGTINVDHGYVHRIEDWQFLAGALDAMRALQVGNYALAVVTNQSGIARGYYSAAEVLTLHEHMKQEAARAGVSIDAVAYCPHQAEARCSCRKPGTQMSSQIEQQLGGRIDYRHSWTVGDKLSDIAFGASLGTQTALLSSPYWSDGELSQRPNLIADSLQQVAAQILGSESQDLSRGDGQR